MELLDGDGELSGIVDGGDVAAVEAHRGVEMA